MDEKQINKLLGVLVEHQSFFSDLPTADAQWVIQNPKGGIALFIEAIQNRKKEVESLLKFIDTVAVAMTTKKFIARDKFVVDTGKKAKVKISFLSNVFKEEFLNKVEDPIGAAILGYHKLLQFSVDTPIIAELGGEGKVETSLTEMFSLMEMQSNGESGKLLTNGYANIFYIRNSAGVLRAVDVDWIVVGWFVSADSVGIPYRWGAGDRVFSRNSLKS